MIGHVDRQFGDRGELVHPDVEGDALTRLLRLVQQAGVEHLMLEVDGVPVGIVVATQVGRELLLAPVLHRTGEFFLGRLDPADPRYGGMATGQMRLGFCKQGAQQLTLPAVPDAGSDCANVDDSQNDKQAQPLGALHHRREVDDGLVVRQVAHLRRFAHQQMMAHQPYNGFGFGSRQPEAGAQ